MNERSSDRGMRGPAQSGQANRWPMRMFIAGVLFVLAGRIIGRYFEDFVETAAIGLTDSGRTWQAALARLAYIILSDVIRLAGFILILFAAANGLTFRKGGGSASRWDHFPGFPERSPDIVVSDGGVSDWPMHSRAVIFRSLSEWAAFIVVPVAAFVGYWFSGKALEDIAALGVEIRELGLRGPLVIEFLTAFMIVMGIFGIFAVLTIWRRRSCQLFKLYLSSEPAMPGDTLRLELTQEQGGPVKEALIRLVCLESCHGALEHESDWSAVIHSEDKPLAVSGESEQSGLVFRTEMRVPPGAVHSFKAKHNAIRWYFAVKMKDIDDIEHELEFDFRVAPEYNLRIAPHADDEMMEQDSPILEEA